ncbi:hypothetical protein I3843_03G245100 [Carya illinoinensis]|nr:hypothetical protein I3760_03G253700 [Carya illinoinensis]KAG7989542.1 hypothetical protein I3843_03G245100 [Carya illinoinensis]
MTLIRNLGDEWTRSRTDNSGLHFSRQFWPRHLLTLTKSHQRTVEQTNCVETNQRGPNLVLRTNHCRTRNCEIEVEREGRWGLDLSMDLAVSVTLTLSVVV